MRPARATCPDFAPAVNYAVAGAPNVVVSADLDRDGNADLVVSNGGLSPISVLLGHGDGTFASAVNYTVGDYPHAVATGDFNGDGKPDVVVVHEGSQNLSILLGNGDGTLATAVTYSAGSHPAAVVVADFNRDGKADLAVGGGSVISILVGYGDGTFAAAVSHPVAVGIISVTLGDLNRDGNPDLAVPGSGKVAILLGDGKGDFADAPSTNVLSPNVSSVSIGDFNGDGKQDLGASNRMNPAVYGVSILLGNGDGTFAPQFEISSGGDFAFFIASADFNGDGRIDLAVSASNGINVLLGKGDGTFGLAGAFQPSAQSFAISDFNRDGKLDLAVPGGAVHSVSILLGSGVCQPCSTVEPARNYAAGSSPASVSSADFNADGEIDLVTANTDANDISILFGHRGVFTPPIHYGTGDSPQFVAVTDLNCDGKADLAVANSGSNNVSVLMGAADGSFAPAVSYGAGSAPWGVAAGDFNRDGIADLAVANNGSDDVSILLGEADSTFAAAINYSAGDGPRSVAAEDLNVDGKLDLVVANANSANVSILRGNGDGTFAAAVPYAAGTNPDSVAVGDFNGDGRPDLAIANDGSNNVSILIGNGNGMFSAAVDFAVGTHPVFIAITDWNGDGKTDLAIADHGSDDVSILIGHGDGTFDAPINWAVGSLPLSLAIADVDCNGKGDVVTANGGSDDVSVRLRCPVPDLIVTKVHTGDFRQGQAGATFTITVSNTGTVPSFGAVTVIDTLPAGLTAKAISGTGWTCTFGTLACTRDDALAGEASFPPITLTVDVALNAKSSVTNVVTVSGGGEVFTVNNTANDVAWIFPVADLTVAKTHVGYFTPGQTGATYTLTVKNLGPGATAGTVTATDSLPAALTATAISGSGWVCDLPLLTCSRSDVLAANTSYPPITLTVTVANDPPFSATNTAAVSGGGEVNTTNDTASDVTICRAYVDLTINTTHSQYSLDRGSRASFTLTVTNVGSISTIGTVRVANYLPAVLSPYSISGTGWTCDNTLTTCSRSDGLAANASHPPIELVVSVGSDAPATVTITSVVAGGEDIVSNNNVFRDMAKVNGTVAACSSFATPVPYATAGFPDAVATGDFNGDGRPDVAVANSYNDNVSILLGNGNATFAAATYSAVGDGPSSIAVADLNHDGRLDLAVTNFDSNTVSILLGHGDGIFLPAVNYGPFAGLLRPIAVAAADLNGDSNTDLAIAIRSSNAVFVLPGHGDGTFDSGRQIGVEETPESIAVGDFNGDGKPDLAVATSGGSYAGDYRVSILTGIGDGTFTLTTAEAGARPYSVAVGDFNSDGKADLAVLNDILDTIGTVSILRGNGNGTFAARVSFPVGLRPRAVAIADLNGDGILDLAVAKDPSSYISTLLGNGDGTFASAVDYPAGGAPRSIAVGDFDLDGRPDLAVADYVDHGVSILLNNGVCATYCGAFAPSFSVGVGSAPDSVAVADFNRDGSADLAFANQGSNNVSILLGTGNGPFLPAVNYDAGSGPHSVSTADFDRDGKPDLAIADLSANQVAILLGLGDGTFPPALMVGAGTNPVSAAAGDFNEDGKADLAVANSGSNDVSILLGNGGGTFAPQGTPGVGSNPESIAAGDFDGDGHTDLAVANNGSGTISVLLGLGDGSFGAVIAYSAGSHPAALTIRDLNEDGAADLVVVNVNTDGVSILLGNGDGTFASAVHYSTGATPRSVTTGDFNGDGKVDLAVGSETSGNVSLLLGDGSGTYGAVLQYAVGTDARALAAGDFDGNGKQDLAVAINSSDTASILLNTCPAADLTITKTHAGAFTQGDVGKTYTLTVQNVGLVPSAGTVTVVDTLPGGFTRTAINGSGWTCTLSTLTCVRSDSLEAGASYPPITLTLNVSTSLGAGSYINVASVSGGRQFAVGNDTARDATTVLSSGLIAPNDVSATAASISKISLSWHYVTSASTYQVFRSSNNAPFELIGTTYYPQFSDTTVAPNTCYLYYVKSVSGDTVTGPSNVDLATTILFTNDPVSARSTVIQAIHFTQLRIAVNAVRAAAGLPSAPFTDSITQGGIVKAAHLSELRSYLDEARSTLGLSAMVYTDALDTPTIIKAVHIQELRSGVK